MSEEWCCEKLENLKIKENRINTLQEIRVRLNEVPNLEAVITNKLLSAPEIYECLDEAEDVGSQREQLDLASDILSICMSNLSLNQNDLPRLLERSISHVNPKIRALALNTILRELQTQHSSNREVKATIGDVLLVHVMKALQETETSVGVPAVGILSIVLEHKIDENFVKEALLKTLNSNEIIKCRVFELAVNLAKISSEMLKKVEHLLDAALAELDNDDVLVQVNILEIFVPLSEQNHGQMYLEQHQVFDVLSRRVEAIEQKPLDKLLVPGIMKFFGKIACFQPQKMLTGYPHMIECLFECLRSGDTSILPIAYDTLANLAQTNQGKLLLERSYSGALKDIFREFSSHLRNLSSELKNRAFLALKLIFVTEGEVTSELNDILQKWFTHLAGNQNMQFLMDFCRNPFPDIKVACLEFIAAIGHYNWGVVALKNTAGFVEYLLDRKIEFNKDAKYAKYEVLKLLAESNVFDLQTQLQLQTYVNEGPYYVQSSMEIALESN